MLWAHATLHDSQVRYDAATSRTVSLKLMLKEPASDYRPLGVASKPSKKPSALLLPSRPQSGRQTAEETDGMEPTKLLAVDLPPGDNTLLATLQERGVTIVAVPPDADVVTALDIVLQVLLLGLLVFALGGGLGGGQGVGGLLTKKFQAGCFVTPACLRTHNGGDMQGGLHPFIPALQKRTSSPRSRLALCVLPCPRAKKGMYRDAYWWYIVCMATTHPCAGQRCTNNSCPPTRMEAWEEATCKAFFTTAPVRSLALKSASTLRLARGMHCGTRWAVR
jgi:hypothetical protein